MQASAQEVSGYGGWSVAVDNDLLAAREQDRDYTGGIALTVSGPEVGRRWWSLDPVLRRLDALAFGDLAFDAAGPSWVDRAMGASRERTLLLYSAQAGIVGFTPQDIANEAVLPEDRPYASLMFVTSARQYVDPSGERVRHSALTLGALGLSLTSNLHDAIHKAVGSSRPQGYHNQISAGGEPTLRYVLGESKLRSQRIALGSGLMETKTTAEMSVGYLTEASYAVSTRIGAISSPWWTFNPERIDYIAQPTAVTRNRGEMYFWAGAKLRVRAYNAFLQGQFRDSAHSFAIDEVQPVIGEAWVGFTSQLTSGTTMSYAVRYQTAELRRGVGRRDPVWAGVTITHSFM